MEKTKQSFNKLNESFVYLDKTANQDFENDSELFIYKHVIESSLHMFELWNQLMISMRNEHQLTVKVNQINIILERFRKVYDIYTYLSKVNLKSMMTDMNKNEMNNFNIDKLKNKIAISITQIDGAIVRLDKLLEKKVEDKNTKSEDIFSRELVLMLGTTVLDNAFLRKLVYSLIYSILLDKSPKEEDTKHI